MGLYKKITSKYLENAIKEVENDNCTQSKRNNKFVFITTHRFLDSEYLNAFNNEIIDEYFNKNK